MDLEENAPSSPSYHWSYAVILGRPGNILRLGLLSKHGLALGGETGTRRDKSAEFLHKILCRLPHRNELGPFCCGCGNCLYHNFCFFNLMLAQLEGLEKRTLLIPLEILQYRMKKIC